MKDHLVRCIETNLGWGSGDTWSNKDFEELSERIFNTTNKRLSVTTLKRIWGRAEWVANPSVATLDILSEFLGHKDWREFVSANKQELPEQKISKKSKPSKIWILVLSLVLIGSFFAFFWRTDSNDDKEASVYTSEDFAFNGESVTTGLPNSVVFTYDASVANEKAKIEIQQDWDERKRVVVDKEDSVSTSIYYWPGYFKSKLVVDDSIVKEKDLLIPSPDWLGTIETDSLPIYLDKEDYRNENGLTIESEALKKYGIDPRTKRTAVGLYQVRDFGELYTNDFEMTTTLRNDFKSGKSLCQVAQVMIMHEDGPVVLTLADKGCISDISLYAFEKSIDGKKTDLSGFGVDFADFVKLKCVSKNQKLDILINNKVIFSFDVPKTPKKIIGINFHFEGGGSVQNVEFKNDGGVVYTSGF
ncbi:hypothetical protein [Maribacter halichondriae]|uniref:hypothetical protein n=1 Tax=Maribacter halichondriae TaxID=2980554 RepID=UPI00235821E3|nr:hypothetical protein [Maribacter sp. Hal144]